VDLQSAIASFFEHASYPVLFAGAGVSARAGIKTWAQYLTTLAESIRSSDALSANIMTEQIAKGQFLKAAEYFLLSSEVRDADKYDLLAAPLKQFKAGRVVSIAKLPFRAYVTTNFDRALHDAYAREHQKAPIAFDLGDPALASAPFFEDFFVARVHGKVEDPRTMVLSETQYASLASRDGYLQILRDILAYKQVLFLGFSFFDPAIRKVLEVVNAEYGPITAGRHLALLPSDVSAEFVGKLNRFNVDRVLYNPARDHSALWEALDALVREPSRPAPHPGPAQAPEPMATAKRYIASCYARAQLGNQIFPLRKAVIEGMVCHLLASASKEGITKPKLAEALKNDLKIRESDALRLVDNSLKRLTASKACEKVQAGSAGVLYRWTREMPEDHDFENALNILVKGVIERYVVREGGQDTSDVRKALKSFFQQAILKRGWDLGAAFAAKEVPEHADIEKLLWSVSNLLAPGTIDGLLRACYDLFRAPDTREAQILINLGRASFALELALQAPKDTLLHQLTLPQRIYLDANVLLPAITVGHPFHGMYKESLTRLVEAAKGATTHVRVVTFRGFLNEVVSHRRLASEQITRMKEDSDRVVLTQARVFGSTNINVFLSAYINLAADTPGLTFDDFLATYAPYENEAQLGEWLSKLKITVLDPGTLTSAETIYGTVYHHLEVMFADELASGKRNPLLLQHDAVQLAALARDRREGIKTLFVTADKRLRENIANSKFVEIASNFISHVGLVQLIDLLIGIPDGFRTLESMLWATAPSSELDIIRNYLIDIGLQKYGAGLAMNMSKVVERTAQEVVDKAHRDGIVLFADSDIAHARAAQLIESFEDGYYESLREEIERARRAPR
jgi:hypothetical protein